jgi:hypothetical protein
VDIDNVSLDDAKRKHLRCRVYLVSRVYAQQRPYRGDEQGNLSSTMLVIPVDPSCTTTSIVCVQRMIFVLMLDPSSPNPTNFNSVSSTASSLRPAQAPRRLIYISSMMVRLLTLSPNPVPERLTLCQVFVVDCHDNRRSTLVRLCSLSHGGHLVETGLLLRGGESSALFGLVTVAEKYIPGSHKIISRSDRRITMTRQVFAEESLRQF